MGGRAAEISALDAKSRLPQLLRETARGRSFVIRERGKAVARLIPPAEEAQARDLAQILASFREIRKRIAGTLMVRQLIEEGRRY